METMARLSLATLVVSVTMLTGSVAILLVIAL
jgi:hypothetical protein